MVEDTLRDLGINYEHKSKIAGEPFLTREGALTAAVNEAIKEEIGVDAELSTSGGTSDGRFIAPYGVDVVEIGPINATIHQVNEEGNCCECWISHASAALGWPRRARPQPPVPRGNTQRWPKNSPSHVRC
jgi:hypothetical protein